MPRYRANLKFGPWKRGDEFESEDPFHARLAEAGRVVSKVGGGAGPEAPAAPDAASAEEPEGQPPAGGVAEGGLQPPDPQLFPEDG